MIRINHAPLRIGATADYEYSKGLESMLTYMSKFGDVVQMFKRTGNTIHVPRGLVDPSKIIFGTDHRAPGIELSAIDCALKARNDDQRQVLENSLAYLKAGVDHIIEAPTGFGKTFVGITLAMQMRRPTLIVVTKEDLVSSWRKMLTNSPTAESEPGMGLPSSMIGHLQADVEDWKGKRFVIGMVHSLVKKDKYPQEMWRYFGMGIFDEVHRLGADTFQEVCNLLQAKHRLGLSATPDRSDGKDRVFQSHIGPVLVKGTAIPMKPKVLIKQTRYKLPEWVPQVPGRLMTANKLMAKDKMRNALIIEFVLKAKEAGRTVVIMTSLVEDHVKPLFHLLCAAGISGDEIGMYIGQNTNDKVKAKAALDLAKTKKIVLATYNMTKEGTDVPQWDTLVLALPLGDVKQAIGRVMRSKKDKKQPVILDLVDWNILYQNFAKKRLSQYYSVGADIVNMV
jgi:superfamily II DNA or RNA helicase